MESKVPKSEKASALLLVGVLMMVTSIALCIQAATWIPVTDHYYADDPLDNNRGGHTFTCGCSLPPNLQTSENPKKKTSMNVCYESSSLQTVKVLMYSNSTVGKMIDQVIEKNSLPPPIKRTVEKGLRATQEGHDITLELASVVEDNSNYSFLAPLYLSGNQQKPDESNTLDFFQGSTFTEFPDAYMRTSWLYECTNCTQCGLEVVNKLGATIFSDNGSPRVSCFSSRPPKDCQSHNSYEGKCVLYPPTELPANFAGHRFLTALQNLPGISGFWASKDYVTLTANMAQLEPSILYLNISNVTNTPIEFNFLELEEGSPTREELLKLNSFPSLDNECSDFSPVKICNGTSICNMFLVDDSDYELRCLDSTSPLSCAPWIENNTIFVDNVALNNVTMEEVICPPVIQCYNTPPIPSSGTLQKAWRVIRSTISSSPGTLKSSGLSAQGCAQIHTRM